MIDLRPINQEQFQSAKTYWMLSIMAKILIAAIGIWTVFEVSSLWTPQLLLLLALVSELFQLRSDGLKSRAEAVLRILDLCESFGHEISASDTRDFAFSVPKSVRSKVEEIPASAYFDTKVAIGPQRAAMNLIESAWYTRRQAGTMALIYGALIAGLFAFSIAALMIATRNVADQEVRERIVRVVTAWLLLLVSVNMLRNVWGYFKLYERCRRTEVVCTHLAKGDVSEPEITRQWYEYQIARVGSPLIPEWLWNAMKSRLDKAWAASKTKAKLN